MPIRNQLPRSTMEGVEHKQQGHQGDDNPPPVPGAQHGGARGGWLLDPAILALLFLSVNVAIGVYRSRGDLSTMGFLFFSYFDLLLLFFCLRRFERLTADARPEERTRLKATVWLLSTALIVAFSCRVSVVIPWALAALVWVMAGSVTVGGFYALILYEEKADKRER